MSRGKPGNGYYALRWKILERDKFTCQYCGQYAPNVRLEVDHIIRVEDGGTDDPDNLKTSCYACNQGKEGLRTQRLVRPYTKGLAPKSLKAPPNFLRTQIANALISQGPMNYKRIAERIQASPQSVSVTLSRHNDLFTKLGEGKWAAKKDGFAIKCFQSFPFSFSS